MVSKVLAGRAGRALYVCRSITRLWSRWRENLSMLSAGGWRALPFFCKIEYSHLGRLLISDSRAESQSALDIARTEELR